MALIGWFFACGNPALFERFLVVLRGSFSTESFLGVFEGTQIGEFPIPNSQLPETQCETLRPHLELRSNSSPAIILPDMRPP